MRASVVILTKNAGPFLDLILTSISAQRVRFSPEILVIDSGSTDETRQRVRRHCARLLEIAPEEFNHGTTRNLAMELSSGEAVALLSQDALPADNCWLAGLLEPLIQDERIAGSFSKHVPRSNSSPLVKRQVLEFDLCGSDCPRINEWEREIPLQRACFFANTSSCIRRSVWENFPFQQMDFAEDQDWSRRILQAGLATAYAPQSTVLHSHDYGLKDLFMRHFEHARAMYAIYGEKEIPGRFPFQWMRDQVGGDLRYLRSSHELSRLNRIKWSFKSPGWQMVRWLGLWLGSNASRWPSFLANSLSLQRHIART